MSRPTISYIECSGKQCDYFAPDEGNCRACMMEALKTATQEEGIRMATLRKIEAMHHFYGEDHLERKCEECDHLIHGEYHGKMYYKCKVYGCSHSEATDWRKSYPACGLVDHDFPVHDNRIIDILKVRPIEKVEQIPGQTTML